MANCEDANDTDTPVTEPCQAWIYDKSQIQSSIVTDVIIDFEKKKKKKNITCFYQFFFNF